MENVVSNIQDQQLGVLLHFRGHVRMQRKHRSAVVLHLRLTQDGCSGGRFIADSDACGDDSGYQRG